MAMRRMLDLRYGFVSVLIPYDASTPRPLLGFVGQFPAALMLRDMCS
jgi:hypothetical protein